MQKTRFSIQTLLSLVVAVAIIFPVTTVMAGQFTPKAGQYYTHRAEGATFHIYTTPTPMGASSSVIIETPNGLIMQDVHQAQANNADLNALIASLKKPLERIYISHDHDHHWLGLEAFPGVPVYASATTIQTIKEKGAEMLAAAKKQFGDKMVPYNKVIVPQHELKSGPETIDGVRLVYTPHP